MKKLFLSLGFLTLCISLGLAIFDANRELPTPTFTQPLKELLPMGEAFGWASEDLPLGDTEAIDVASHRILNLTDFVYRRYTRGTDSFEVYIGYWAPGTMPAREMNQYTPDTCWVNAGWEAIESENGRVISSNRWQSAPGLWRHFFKDRNSINVIFWHLLEGKPYRFGHQSFNQRVKQLVLDPFRNSLNMRRDQYLVRFSSTNELTEVWEDPLLESIFESVTFTGVADSSDKSNPSDASLILHTD